MKKSRKWDIRINLTRNYILLILSWSIVLIISLIWNLYSLKQEVLSMATLVARTNLNKDLTFRLWATSHGGVYVPPTKQTPPNPYLNIPNRDVTTTTGIKLTLMNPAYVVRELQDKYETEFLIKSKITSLKPLNPQNTPDVWEKESLTAFQNGESERQELFKIDGKEYLRLMKPFITEEGCLKCHGIQGYKVGEIRGGISSSVAIESFLFHEDKRKAELSLSHFAIWLIGSLSFFFWYHRSRKFTEDRYKTEEALRASEARYRSFVEKTSIVSWTTNPAGEVTEDIPSFRAFTGQSYEDVKGNGWSKGVHPDDLSKTLEVWKKAVETKGEYNIIYRLKRYDGEYRYMSIRGVPVLDVKGKIQEWIGTGQDITEQKIAENKLKQREASLNDAQRLTHLGSWDYDIVNNNLAWSDEFYRIYEINPAEFGASYEAFLAAVHPDDRDFVDKSYTNSVKNKTPYNIVHRLLMADGRIKYIHEIGETFYDETGKPLRSIGTGQDITERKLAQDKIQNLNDELEKRVAKRTAQLESANKELETFSYSVSHDLRTPLRAIDGYSMILLEEYNDKLDDEGKRLLNVVRSNTERMSKLIDDILHFSRAGRASISFSDTDLESVLKDILESLEPEIKKKSIQINVGQLPRAVCDRGMIHQVFENLITNAVKFSGKKENPVIEIAGKIEGDNAIYYVKDNGAGFDMKYVSKLFGVFQRLHSDEEFEGTGIGLAIVKQIINRHGGSVWAESEPEKGATFYFSIPLVQTIQEAEHDTQ